MTRRSRLLKASGMFLVIVLMAFMPIAMSDGSEKPDDYTYCVSKYTTDLTAGQHIDAGDIIISNNKDTLYVEFVTEDHWYLVETHVAVGDSLDEIPQTKKKNPIPGQFDHKTTHSEKETYYIYEIDRSELSSVCGQTIYIAAHAVVRKDTSCGYKEETGWGDGKDFDGKNWAMYIEYTLRCCPKDPEFPSVASVKFAYPGSSTDSYWTATPSFSGTYGNMESGTPYAAWCVQGTYAAMNPGTYNNLDLINSYSDDEDLPNADWERINWVINYVAQNPTEYTVSEIQDAIWYFSGYISTIYELAQKAIDDGEGFLPGPNMWIAIYVKSKQPTFIVIDP